MQPKVSMVMPCYNKKEYIGEMLDSIIAQVWNNIELILVNDGSTDGTREVIAEYETKLRQRGFEVVIIDQENAGVCAAAKAGLERITGDYVCQVDADDELDPEYVSTMAGWLEEHADVDFCACDKVSYVGRGNNKKLSPYYPKPIDISCKDLVDQYLMVKINATVWVYMVRKSYFIKCGITKTYYTNSRGSHEPSFVVPLLAFGGKIKQFLLPLYRWNVGDDGMSRFREFKDALRYYDDYKLLCEYSVNALPDKIVDKSHKDHWLNIAELSRLKILDAYVYSLPNGSEYAEEMISELVRFAGKLSNVELSIPVEHKKLWVKCLINAVENMLLGGNLTLPIAKAERRVIAIGARGNNAAMMIPALHGFDLKPTILWDATTDKEEIEKFGMPIGTPQFDQLQETDIVLVFPSNKNIVAGIKLQFETIKVHKVLYYQEILDYLIQCLFPQLFKIQE